MVQNKSARQPFRKIEHWVFDNEDRDCEDFFDAEHISLYQIMWKESVFETFKQWSKDRSKGTTSEGKVDLAKLTALLVA